MLNVKLHKNATHATQGGWGPVFRTTNSAVHARHHPQLLIWHRTPWAEERIAASAAAQAWGLEEHQAWSEPRQHQTWGFHTLWPRFGMTKWCQSSTSLLAASQCGRSDGSGPAQSQISLMESSDRTMLVKGNKMQGGMALSTGWRHAP